jgi:hypothetical protein
VSDNRSGTQTADLAWESVMPRIHPWITDSVNLVSAATDLLAALPPAAIYGYLLVRLLIPVILIRLAIRGATPPQKIALVQSYLTGLRFRSKPTLRRR